MAEAEADPLMATARALRKLDLWKDLSEAIIADVHYGQKESLAITQYLKQLRARVGGDTVLDALLRDYGIAVEFDDDATHIKYRAWSRARILLDVAESVFVRLIAVLHQKDAGNAIVVYDPPSLVITRKTEYEIEFCKARTLESMQLVSDYLNKRGYSTEVHRAPFAWFSPSTWFAEPQLLLLAWPQAFNEQ
jgi:hypothetical protein